MFESVSVVDALMCPDDTAAYLAAAMPGAEVAAPLSVLDPSRLSHAGRVDALVAVERQIAWLQAAQQRLLAPIAADDASDDQWVREEVACALRLSGVTASRRLAVAQALAERLPGTLELLATGQSSYLHAMTLAEATYGLTVQARGQVEARVAGRAGEQTLSEFTRAVRRAVAAAAPATVEEQREQAMAERRVVITPRDDAMSELWALLPAEGAAALKAAIDSLASVTSASDPRSADQRCADALVDLAVAALHDPNMPTAQGLRPTVQVTVAASTLLGADDQPAELAGHGPIPASLARQLAADQTGTWRRLVTGNLLDYDSTAYRPPKNVADHVIARDQVCTFPGCRRPAHRCDLDHQHPASAGGTTSVDNLAALCRRHHRAKHQAGWRPRRVSYTGDVEWVSPTGHRHVSRRPDHPRDRTAPEPPPP